MTQALDCLICHPPELDRLVLSEPALAAQWVGLPRKQLAAKAVYVGPRCRARRAVAVIGEHGDGKPGPMLRMASGKFLPMGEALGPAACTAPEAKAAALKPKPLRRKERRSNKPPPAAATKLF